jgi:hypothetical protein
MLLDLAAMKRPIVAKLQQKLDAIIKSRTKKRRHKGRLVPVVAETVAQRE